MYTSEMFDINLHGSIMSTNIVTWDNNLRMLTNYKKYGTKGKLYLVPKAAKGDPEAIMVVSSGRPIGYIPRKLAGKRELYNHLVDGGKYSITSRASAIVASGPVTTSGDMVFEGDQRLLDLSVNSSV